MDCKERKEIIFHVNNYNPVTCGPIHEIEMHCDSKFINDFLLENIEIGFDVLYEGDPPRKKGMYVYHGSVKENIHDFDPRGSY